MAHEARTPVFINGVLSQRSHELLLGVCRETTPDTLIPHSLPVTLANLGHFAVKGAPNASFNTAEYIFERSSPRTLEYLAQVERRLHNVMLGGAGITAVGLNGMMASDEAVAFRLSGNLDEVAQRRLNFVEELRKAKKLEGEVEQMLSREGPHTAAIGLRFRRQPGEAADKKKDEAFYGDFHEAVAAIERLELYGQPRIEYGRTGIVPPQLEQRPPSRQAS